MCSAVVRVYHELNGVLRFCVIVNDCNNNGLAGVDGEERAAPLGISPYGNSVLSGGEVAGQSLCIFIAGTSSTLNIYAHGDLRGAVVAYFCGEHIVLLSNRGKSLQFNILVICRHIGISYVKSVIAFGLGCGIGAVIFHNAALKGHVLHIHKRGSVCGCFGVFGVFGLFGSFGNFGQFAVGEQQKV